uniref:Uncharacterized protein n=1 Tax=Spironucleus salmonicida TaxID=348837 RepID=V6LET6_9EUKA|eukprot:EST42778.1 Hypothetical protein SS50377_17544 [Spironucleus salmonicida]
MGTLSQAMRVSTDSLKSAVDPNLRDPANTPRRPDGGGAVHAQGRTQHSKGRPGPAPPGSSTAQPNER